MDGPFGFACCFRAGMNPRARNHPGSVRKSPRGSGRSGNPERTGARFRSRWIWYRSRCWSRTRKGNALTGLKPENFTIYEDNVKQEISNFSPIEANITAVMLVEYSNNVSNFISDVWNAMYDFANSLRKEDWVAVIGYDMLPTILCDFTQDRSELEDTLRRFQYPARLQQPVGRSYRRAGPDAGNRGEGGRYSAQHRVGHIQPAHL